jgi:hypothetical protein|nr:MAG TPA: hypothetical protein [Caudoviricetes sp.]
MTFDDIKEEFRISDKNNMEEIQKIVNEQEYIKVKRSQFRGEGQQHYFYIEWVNAVLSVECEIDRDSKFDDIRFNHGNYFGTIEEAEIYLKKISGILAERTKFFNSKYIGL